MSSVPATPYLRIEESIVERNSRRLADYLAPHGIRLRPHTKTHKSLWMARHQVAHGAKGLTVAKVGEAEVMSEASDDILMAYPAIGRERTERLARLAGKCTVRVALDSEFAAEGLAEAARRAGTSIGILVDLDVGNRRTGLQSPQQAQALARKVADTKGLRLDGLFFYPGHIWAPAAEQGGPLAKVQAILAEALDLWKRDGLEAPIVSGGSTPTAYQSHAIAACTEVRPGTYLFNDRNTVAAGFCGPEDCAATLVCTVVSTAVPGKVIIDAGSKTLTSDRNVTQPDSGYGFVVEYPEAVVAKLSEEHGELDVSRCSRPPQLGEEVHIVPNHICPCVNLQDAVWLKRVDGSLERLPVDARGRLT